MARLTAIVAILAVALLIAAEAYPYTGQHEKCRHMSAREEIRSCSHYLAQQDRRVLHMRGIDNPQTRERAYFDQCCQELRNVDEQCRCDMLEEIVMKVQRQERRQEGTQMLQKARNLPSMCRMSPQRCDF